MITTQLRNLSQAQQQKVAELYMLKVAALMTEFKNYRNSYQSTPQKQPFISFIQSLNQFYMYIAKKLHSLLSNFKTKRQDKKAMSKFQKLFRSNTARVLFLPARSQSQRRKIQHGFRPLIIAP